MNFNIWVFFSWNQFHEKKFPSNQFSWFFFHHYRRLEAEKDRRLKAEMEARRKEEEKHNDQLEADRKAARTLQEKLNEENRMLREQIGKKEIIF